MKRTALSPHPLSPTLLQREARYREECYCISQRTLWSPPPNVCRLLHAHAAPLWHPCSKKTTPKWRDGVCGTMKAKSIKNNGEINKCNSPPWISHAVTVASLLLHITLLYWRNSKCSTLTASLATSNTSSSPVSKHPKLISVGQSLIFPNLHPVSQSYNQVVSSTKSHI